MTDRPISHPSILLALTMAATAPAGHGQQVQAVRLPQFEGPSALAFDQVRERLVATDRHGGTFEAQATAWEPRSESAPAAATLVYDSENRVTVAYDGREVREWDGESWTVRRPAASPPRRWNPPLAYDAARGRTVLYGGMDIPTASLGDTWEWDGDSWHRMTPSVSPPALHDHGMAYDSRRRRVVLFGGRNDLFFVPQDQTWEYDGTTWQRRWPTHAPPAAAAPRLVFDHDRDLTVMLSATGVWEYDGVDWSQAAIGETPSGPAAYDATTRDVVVLTLTGLMAWNGTRWRTRAATPHQPKVPARALARDPGTGRTLAFSGMAYAHQAIVRVPARVWNGRFWEAMATPRGRGSAPWELFGVGMAFDPRRQRTLLFGGLGEGRYTDPEPSDETWEWDGTSWTQLAPTNRPPAIHGFAMTWDRGRNRAVIHGAGSGGTWEWDSTNWHRASGANAPPDTGSFAMVYDPIRSRSVLVRGQGSTPLQTWEWDGVAWVRTTPVRSPSPRIDAAMTYWPNRGIVLHGGLDPASGAELDDLWSWDGREWSVLAVTGTLPAASSHILFHDADRRALILTSKVGSWAIGSVEEPRVTRIGNGCGSTLVPPRAAATPPRIGNQAFRIEATNVPSTTPAVVLLSTARGSGRIGGCPIYVDQAALALPATTNAFGQGFASVPIPLDARLRGSTLFAQALALDANAPLGLAITGGLEIRIGD